MNNDLNFLFFSFYLVKVVSRRWTSLFVQIRLWEQERDRFIFSEGVLYNQFLSQADYLTVKNYAEQQSKQHRVSLISCPISRTSVLRSCFILDRTSGALSTLIIFFLKDPVADYVEAKISSISRNRYGFFIYHIFLMDFGFHIAVPFFSNFTPNINAFHYV